MKKRNNLSVRKQFKEAWNFIKESRRAIFFIVAIFFLSSLIGFFFSERFSFLDELLKNLVDETEGFGPLEMIFFILQNNTQTAFLSLLLGVFFGIFPIFNAVTNGVVLGYVLAKVHGISGISDFWRILPHGIFELAAVFIALGMGVRMGNVLLAKDKKKELKRMLYLSLNAFFMIVLPLLILAAVIEGLLIFFV